MPWIESHSELARHPKTLRLARRLSVSLPTAIGHLHLLWWWALEYTKDGDLSGYDDEEIAIACGWDGAPGVLREALTVAGFLDPCGFIHDWDDYAGKLLDHRRANAEKQARWRNRNRPSSIEADNRHVTVTAPVRTAATVPNPTLPTLSPTEREAPDSDEPDAAPAQMRMSLPKSQTTDAVRAANTVLSKKCNEAERAAINEAIPATPQAQTLWESVLRSWRLRYERNRSLEGPLDWFRAGGGPPARTHANGAPRSASSRLDAVIERATSGHGAAGAEVAGGRGGPGVGVPQVRRGLPGQLPG